LSDGAAVLLRGLGFAAGGALFWLIYFDLKDRMRPEPRRLLLLAFLLGCLAALLGLALYGMASLAGFPDSPGNDPLSILLYCLVVVGPVEEGAKFLVFRLLIYRWKHFDEPIDGIVYASAVAIGFAAFESVLYVPLTDWTEQVARSLTSPLTHSLFAAIWGFGSSRARFTARTPAGRFLWQALPLLAAMGIHGLYDFFLLAMNATYIAGAVALALWVPLIIHARRLVGIPHRG
jgi:RsiW-degrading membrane proteinase PrsW (M82 family)